MADISGTVTVEGVLSEATVLLLDATCENVLDETTSDPVTGAYSFTGLAAETDFFVVVLGGGVYRSVVYGPITTEAA